MHHDTPHTFPLHPLFAHETEHFDESRLRTHRGSSDWSQANEGKHYVVIKFHGNHRSQMPANEHAGSAIGKADGIPVAESKFVLFSERSIDSEPPIPGV
jgi:hypothetical protein